MSGMSERRSLRTGGAFTSSAAPSMIRRLVGKKIDPILTAAAAVAVIVVLCAIAPGLIAPGQPNDLGENLLQGPSWHNLLGTDEYGRDILSRIIFGARTELVISVAGVALAVATGV